MFLEGIVGTSNKGVFGKKSWRRAKGELGRKSWRRNKGVLGRDSWDQE